MDRKCEIDPETIECPLCTELLCPPVHQCRNGHIACAACCARLSGNGCPFCRTTPIAHSRCLAIEKIIESLLISCHYAPQGCNEMVKYTTKQEHETKLCEYRPMQCPVPKCMHEGPKFGITGHFGWHVNPDQIVQLDPVSRTVKFKMADFNPPYVLVESFEGLLLVHLFENKAILGDLFCCSSFGSDSQKYNLKVKLSGGSSLCTMETLALDNQECKEIFQKSQLLVVRNLGESQSRLFDLELRLL